MKRLLIVILMLASCQPARANDNTLLAAAVAVSTIDWLQSRDIVRRSEFHERNWFMPDRPSMGEVNNHYLIRTALIVGLSLTFPEYRSSILGAYVAVGLITIGHNAHIGLRVRY